MKKLICALTLCSAGSAIANELPSIENLQHDYELQEYVDLLKHEIRENHANYQLYVESLGQNGEIVPLAPAPKITYLEIRGVYSALYRKWDYVDQNAFSTNQDHGGQFYALTLEYGYAQPSSRRFQINGTTLKLETSEPVKDSGNTVIGWINYWKNPMTDFTSGNATYNGTSINFPYNQESDRLFIR
ncbi:DUF4879 domain-containing protein [Pseudoalteromonas sp. MMG013]|uniref:DUF4879 domain-containing protein n=1 Tax=Pseudoalteromonas sp. MMG013 TaxID=2822687 RepID=UPI001B39630C|nr:DUF4879 domain-containing protein [Pseudoalteromonas sp. MMG013]MBQ4862521.1 DUF4879 domain-containing protein [Pseudoalteromonas sp. MMG013]